MSGSWLIKLSLTIGTLLLAEASMALAMAVPPRHVTINPGQGSSRSAEARPGTELDVKGGRGRGREKVKPERSRGKSQRGRPNRGRAARADGHGRGGSGRGIINAGRSGAPVAAVEGFICPVDPAVATFTNDWGAPRSGSRYHQGTDVFAPQGTPLVAVVDGVVTLSRNRLGGLVVHLTAENGTRYYYAHLSDYLPDLESGDEVSRGSLIAFVGNSGNARGTPPHVHFQIHPYGGDPVNPYPTLSEACATSP